MESYPLEDGGDNFIVPWGTLNFHLFMVELSQMGGLKIFRLFWGDNGVFSTGGMGRVSAPLTKNLLSPRQPVKILPSRQKVPHLYTNKQFSCYNPPYKIFIFSCSHCSCTSFILLPYSLYAQVMLILMLINVQYLQNVVFSFEKVWVVKITPCQILNT